MLLPFGFFALVFVCWVVISGLLNSACARFYHLRLVIFLLYFCMFCSLGVFFCPVFLILPCQGFGLL